MIRGCREYGIREPEFIDMGDAFRVNFYRSNRETGIEKREKFSETGIEKTGTGTESGMTGIEKADTGTENMEILYAWGLPKKENGLFSKAPLERIRRNMLFQNN